MNRAKTAIIVLIVFNILLVVISTLSFSYKEGEGNSKTYNCDVKNIRLSTDIEVNKDGEYIKKIKGNVFKIVTDPLTLYDKNDKKLGYASDEYAIVNQDTHMLRVGKTFYIMHGKIKILGEEYELLDEDGNYIGMCEFNYLNTKGMIKNANGEVVANYKSKLFFRDFDVVIYENCEIEDDAILMICGSYYSDQHYKSTNND